MMLRIKLVVVLCVALCLLGICGAAAGQDCAYRDPDTGEATMHIGGAALADLMGQVDPNENFGIPSDYNIWDVNGDGILDKVQFELLTEILCAPTYPPHPTMDFAEIQATFEDNLALYWNLINTMKAKEAAMIEGAPVLRDASIALRDAADAAGMLNDLLPAEAFIGEMPEEWVGKTWEDLRFSMRECADGIIWMEGQGYIGSPTSPVWLVLTSTATAHIMSALWGLDSSFTASLFEVSQLDLLKEFLTYQQLNWSYILGLFGAYGLQPSLVAEVDYAIDNIGLDSSIMPTPEQLVITSGGEDALGADRLWGDVTLLDLYLEHGTDVGAIWEEILNQLPGLPVSGLLGLFALAAVCTASGIARLKRKASN